MTRIQSRWMVFAVGCLVAVDLGAPIAWGYQIPQNPSHYESTLLPEQACEALACESIVGPVVGVVYQAVSDVTAIVDRYGPGRMTVDCTTGSAWHLGAFVWYWIFQLKGGGYDDPTLVGVPYSPMAPAIPHMQYCVTYNSNGGVYVTHTEAQYYDEVADFHCTVNQRLSPSFYAGSTASGTFAGVPLTSGHCNMMPFGFQWQSGFWECSLGGWASWTLVDYDSINDILMQIDPNLWIQNTGGPPIRLEVRATGALPDGSCNSSITRV